jgi:hypothetical protein
MVALKSRAAPACCLSYILYSLAPLFFSSSRIYPAFAAPAVNKFSPGSIRWEYRSYYTKTTEEEQQLRE